MQRREISNALPSFYISILKIRFIAGARIGIAMNYAHRWHFWTTRLLRRNLAKWPTVYSMAYTHELISLQTHVWRKGWPTWDTRPNRPILANVVWKDMNTQFMEWLFLTKKSITTTEWDGRWVSNDGVDRIQGTGDLPLCAESPTWTRGRWAAQTSGASP